MTFFKDLLADLISKRLWPVAIALLVALVAVPTVLSKSDKPDGSALAAAQAAAARAARDATANQPVVLLAGEKSASGRIKNLAARDPFRQQHVPKPQTSAASTTTGGPSAGSTPSDGSSGGGGSGSSNGGPGGTGHNPTPPKTYTIYKVDVSFGEAGASRTRRDISRGTVLPSSEEPVVCFEGTLNDGVTAVFALCSDAAVQGDGECKPSKANCQKIYLKAGESEFLDVAAGTGGLVQYELKVLKVSKTTTTSRSRALRAYARVSKTGRAVMSASSSGRALLRYSAVSGVLFPTAAAKR